MKAGPSPMPYRKKSSRWIMERDIRTETVKLLEEDMGANTFSWAWTRQWFLSCDTKHIRDKKRKMENLDHFKIQNFGVTSNTVKKMKRQPTEWEKILANHMSDNELASCLYKRH